MSDSKSTELKQLLVGEYGFNANDLVFKKMMSDISLLHEAECSRRVEEARIDELHKAIAGLFPGMSHPSPDSDPVMRITADAVVHYENERLAALNNQSKEGGRDE